MGRFTTLAGLPRRPASAQTFAHRPASPRRRSGVDALPDAVPAPRRGCPPHTMPRSTRACDMCGAVFLAERLFGRVSRKAVIEQQRRWGHDDPRARRLKPATLYDPQRLCAFCGQFFGIAHPMDGPAAPHRIEADLHGRPRSAPRGPAPPVPPPHGPAVGAFVFGVSANPEARDPPTPECSAAPPPPVPCPAPEEPSPPRRRRTPLRDRLPRRADEGFFVDVLRQVVARHTQAEAPEAGLEAPSWDVGRTERGAVVQHRARTAAMVKRRERRRAREAPVPIGNVSTTLRREAGEAEKLWLAHRRLELGGGLR